MAPDTADLVSRIYNDWYMVRHYWRGARSSIARAERQAAIRKLGLTVRYAFSASEDFEALLAAVVDGGRPRDTDPPF
jgi:hypothetical protein